MESVPHKMGHRAYLIILYQVGNSNTTMYMVQYLYKGFRT